MAQIEYDFTRICRTCKIAAEDMKSVFDYCEVFNEGPRIDEMLMACTSLQVKVEDGLPRLICIKCVVQLRNAYEFKNQCHDTDLALREYSKHLNNDDIKEEMQNIEALCNDSIADAKEQAAQSDYIELMDNNQMILTCRECGKAFTTLDGLRSHKRIHLGTLFKCRFCSKGFTRQTHVYRHELCHGKHKIHVCKICGKTLTRTEHLKRHLTTHLREKPFNCTSCNRGFNRSDHLEVHAIKCKGERIHICSICNRGFAREDSLEVHKRLHENQTPVLPTLENIDNIDEHYFEIDFDPNFDYSANLDANSDIDDYLEPQIEVTEDDEKFRREIDLQNEVNVKLNENLDTEIKDLLGVTEESESVDVKEKMSEEDPDYVANGEEEAIEADSSDEERPKPKASPKRKRGRPRKNPELKLKAKTAKRSAIKREEEEAADEDFEKHRETKREHVCKVCSKQFSRFNHLKRHMLSHNIVKPFSCEICVKRFSRRDHLQQHTRLHEKKQEFDCDVDLCTRSFNRADLLAKHKISKHNFGEKITPAVKKFQCNICLKTFTTEKYRDVHVRGHMGEKRFQCKTCEKCFLSKSHLTEHMKFHNEHSKKFLCSECGQRFIRNDYLVIHMRRHRGEKPFKCKFCGKGFPRTTDLTVHERYHTGEKTHLCTICGRGFGRAYNLTVHMRTHTGEKPYQCSYCDAAFAQGNDLKAHVRRHTGERFQCELCSDSFLMGYLLTQHKRSVHGLNVVSNIRRLPPISQIKEDQDTDDKPPPITISLPKPVVPDIVLNSIEAQLAVQLHHQQMRTDNM